MDMFGQHWPGAAGMGLGGFPGPGAGLGMGGFPGFGGGFGVPGAAYPPAAAAPPAPKQPAASRECQWQYVDTKGDVQGPFPSSKMCQWYEHKMLPTTLKLRRTTDSQFATIPQYFPSPLVPFKSPPQPVNQKPPAPAPAPAPAPKNAGAALLAQLQAGGKAAAEQASAGTAASTYPPAGTPPQPKAQGKGKDGKAVAKGQGKAGAAEQGKGKNSHDNNTAGVQKEAGPIGSGKAKAKAKAKEQKQQEPSWDGWDWSSWDWNSWNGQDWNGGGDWQGSDGKQVGAEWKGAPGDPAAAGAKDKEKNGVQAAFGNLKWGPAVDVSDLFPEDPTRKILDEGIVWEEQWVSPLMIRFSQGKIHPFFHERGPISEVMTQIKVRKQDQGKEQGQLRRVEAPFPPVRLLHLREQGVLVTLDNRRLYALQRFALQEWPNICLVKSLCVCELTPTRLRAENRKFTNRLCGLQLEIESRSNAFDTFSWVTEAAHVEAPRFFRPVFFKATDKAVSLLPVLVVHTLLCPSMLAFLRSRWPLIQYLATVLRDPRGRRFSSKRLLLHHVLQLAQPSRKAYLCPQLCIGYKSETVVTLSKGKSCVKSVLSVTKPFGLLEGATSPVSDVQRQVLMALLPMLCLPYARIALRGSMRDCIVTLLIAWGKISAATLQLPQGP